MEAMMKSRLAIALVSSLGFLCLEIAAGCGDGKPYMDTSLTEATVTGIVSVKGKPATGGKINFNPANSSRIVGINLADIGPDGSYTAKTLTGDNQVTFSGEVAIKNNGVGLIREYAVVKSGENKIDYDLMGAGQKVGSLDFSKTGSKKKR
jgi:hypothetical protein